jgi:hypothetical protein
MSGGIELALGWNEQWPCGGSGASCHTVGEGENFGGVVFGMTWVFFLDSIDMIFKKCQFSVFILNVDDVAWLGGHATSTVWLLLIHTRVT